MDTSAMEGPLRPHQPISRAHLSDAKRRLLEERMKGLGIAPGIDAIQPRSAGARVPISAEQHRIWLHAAANADVPLYNEAITIHRYGSFNLQTLNESFTEILRRHEAWRTSFRFVEEELVQIVHPPRPMQLPLIDLSSLPEEARDTEAVRVAAEDAAAPIALDGEWLFRARVVRLSTSYHRVYLTLHHIIFDGVSIYRILMPELAEIYAALEAGVPPALPEPKLQYGDYAIWREQQKSSAAVLEQMEYWKRHLAGKLPILELPTDRPRAAQRSHRGSMECFQIPAALITALRSLSRTSSVTLYMTLLSAFKTLLFLYSGQQDLIIGGVTDARRQVELESLMGYFLDTFALRTYPSADKSFAEYLLEVKTSVLGALAASDVPFDQIARAVQPKRDNSYHPIFQAFFSMEPPVAPFREGWDLTQMDVRVNFAKFDLYLELDERPDHMAARFMYDADLFEASTIRRMIGHYLVLLGAICDTPDKSLGELPLLTGKEFAQLSAPGGWNDTARPFPAETLHALITAQAARSPDAIAVVSGARQWTYAELLGRAEVLASSLQQLGATRGTLVALLHTRSLDLVSGMLAIMMTGAAYLPLDPSTPRARIAICLEDAVPVAILTETALSAEIADAPCPLIFTDKVDRSSQPFSLDAGSSPEDLAYIIHTSGSTGRPKGVEITHASLVNLLSSMQREPGFTSADTLLAVTTISFDIAALEVFLPLLSGGRVVLADRSVAQDSSLLSELIERSNCSVIQATPATWRSLLVAGWTGARNPDGSSRTLKVLCGGESLSRELADRLLQARVELWNMYGPSETTIWSTLWRVQPAPGSISIGCPIANTSAYLLDEQRQLLPVGVPGELYLGGVGLARGYHRRPDLTSSRFFSVAAVKGERLYSTGDICVRHEDGALEWIGRRDNQVKVRGFRVELEAVEAAVLQHPQVEAAAARVWPDPSGGVRLSVYLTGRNGPPPEPAELKHFLRLSVPDYMLPSDVIAMEALPLTSNAKIDRAALPPPDFERVLTAQSVSPRTDEEILLAGLWSELLRMQVVSVDDDFFDLGGHSLLVAHLQQRIAKVSGNKLPMAALFHASTIRQQAALLQQTPGAIATPRGLLKLQPRGTQPTLFWLHPPPEMHLLTGALGEEFPVFGLALTESDLAALKDKPDIRQVAAWHAQTIIEAQPQGPYFLAGFCTGGIVAFETAAQLRAAGHEVSMLIMIDSQNPTFYKRIDSLAVELSKLRFYFRQRYSGAFVQKTLRRRIAARLRKIWNYEQAMTEMEASEQLTNVAAYRYHPDIYEGDVLLLRPVDRPTRLDHLRGWQQVVRGEVIARDVEGHHEELWDEVKVGGVAREIVRVLSRTAPARS